MTSQIHDDVLFAKTLCQGVLDIYERNMTPRKNEEVSCISKMRLLLRKIELAERTYLSRQDEGKWRVYAILSADDLKGVFRKIQNRTSTKKVEERNTLIEACRMYMIRLLERIHTS